MADFERTKPALGANDVSDHQALHKVERFVSQDLGSHNRNLHPQTPTLSRNKSKVSFSEDRNRNESEKQETSLFLVREEIPSTITTTSKPIASILARTIKTVTNITTSSVKPETNTLSSRLQSVSNTSITTRTYVTSTIAAIMKRFIGNLNATVHSVDNIFPTTMKPITNNLTAATKPVKNNLTPTIVNKNFISTTRPAISNLFATTKPSISILTSTIKPVTSTFTSAKASAIKTFPTTNKPVISNFISTTKPVTGSLPLNMKPIISQLTSTVKPDINIPTSVINISNFTSTTKPVLSNITSTIKPVTNKVPATLRPSTYRISTTVKPDANTLTTNMNPVGLDLNLELALPMPWRGSTTHSADSVTPETSKLENERMLSSKHTLPELDFVSREFLDEQKHELQRVPTRTPGNIFDLVDLSSDLKNRASVLDFLSSQLDVPILPEIISSTADFDAPFSQRATTDTPIGFRNTQVLSSTRQFLDSSRPNGMKKNPMLLSPEDRQLFSESLGETLGSDIQSHQPSQLHTHKTSILDVQDQTTVQGFQGGSIGSKTFTQTQEISSVRSEVIPFGKDINDGDRHKSSKRQEVHAVGSRPRNNEDTLYHKDLPQNPPADPHYRRTGLNYNDRLSTLNSENTLGMLSALIRREHLNTPIKHATPSPLSRSLIPVETSNNELLRKRRNRNLTSTALENTFGFYNPTLDTLIENFAEQGPFAKRNQIVNRLGETPFQVGQLETMVELPREVFTHQLPSLDVGLFEASASRPGVDSNTGNSSSSFARLYQLLVRPTQGPQVKPGPSRRKPLTTNIPSNNYHGVLTTHDLFPNALTETASTHTEPAGLASKTSKQNNKMKKLKPTQDTVLGFILRRRSMISSARNSQETQQTSGIDTDRSSGNGSSYTSSVSPGDITGVDMISNVSTNSTSIMGKTLRINKDESTLAGIKDRTLFPSTTRTVDENLLRAFLNRSYILIPLQPPMTDFLYELSLAENQPLIPVQPPSSPPSSHASSFLVSSSPLSPPLLSPSSASNRGTLTMSDRSVPTPRRRLRCRFQCFYYQENPETGDLFEEISRHSQELPSRPIMPSRMEQGQRIAQDTPGVDAQHLQYLRSRIRGRSQIMVTPPP
ncbi:hypothetical protein ElyMa_003614800 [Elysia marginata]|uniref:Uncharacterized protein n=1 Tax=Elysia marginata TaxID=1093978 RepID=A0AAV4ET43_9GAST|nr:hypothetical protein ElyMa_003614800 [Elysia marginata]